MKLISTGILILMFTFTACKEDSPANCSDEFVTYFLKVKGDSLTNFFTIRLSNNDTLHHRKIPSHEGNKKCIVLTDGMSEELLGKEEEFRFIGLIDDSVVIDEMYIFSANSCHIQKNSGKEYIEI